MNVEWLSGERSCDRDRQTGSGGRGPGGAGDRGRRFQLPHLPDPTAAVQIAWVDDRDPCGHGRRRPGGRSPPPRTWLVVAIIAGIAASAALIQLGYPRRAGDATPDSMATADIGLISARTCAPLPR